MLANTDLSNIDFYLGCSGRSITVNDNNQILVASYVYSDISLRIRKVLNLSLINLTIRNRKTYFQNFYHLLKKC